MGLYPLFLLSLASLMVHLVAPAATQFPISLVDDTLIDKATGHDVVFAVSHKLKKSLVFPEDYDFIKRLAYIETHLGESSETFPLNFFGGIWQITEVDYESTKDISLTSYHKQIGDHFQIDWSTTSWNDLLKPLYSALAASLLFQTFAIPIPQILKEQATYWKQFYSHDPSDLEQDFISNVTEWENGTSCRGKMDLLIVLDDSSSVGSNFPLALNFVADLFGSFSLDQVRQGFMTFAFNSRLVFSLDSGLTAEEIQQTVRNTNSIGGGTATNNAILDAVNVFRTASERPEMGVPKIMVLFTDGYSGTGVTDGVIALKKHNITSFAIGIGSNGNQTDYLYSELLEISLRNPLHLFTLNNFHAPEEFLHRLNGAICEIPRKPGLNETTKEELKSEETRTYHFKLPPGGRIIVHLYVTAGAVESYYSHLYSEPSSALYDGQVIVDSDTNIQPNPSNEIWISVKGLQNINRFIFLVVADSDDPGPTTTTITTTTAATTTTLETTTIGESVLPGPGPSCDLKGYYPHENDCRKYYRCNNNVVGDLWETEYECDIFYVWCEDEERCQIEAICPCML